MDLIKTDVIDVSTDTISSTDINMSSYVVTNKEYNNAEKKIIQTRIEQIANKKIHLKIFKIIHEDGRNFMANDNGVFFNLAGLSNNALSKIEYILNTYDSIKQTKKINSKWSNTLNNQIYQHTSTEDKLNNQEKMFLKVNQLDDEITLWNP